MTRGPAAAATTPPALDPLVADRSSAAADVTMSTHRLLAGELTAEIGGGDFRFSAAHTGLHDGRFEAMHGHTYLPTLTLTGVPDPAGMIADFWVVRAALRAARPARRHRCTTVSPSGSPTGPRCTCCREPTWWSCR